MKSASQAIGSVVRRKRIEASLSRNELAQLANVAAKQIQRIERCATTGLGDPKLSTLEALAKGLGCPIQDLLQAVGPPLKKRVSTRSPKRRICELTQRLTEKQARAVLAVIEEFIG